jgi:CDP-ribitol ribitolphosphotransferase
MADLRQRILDAHPELINQRVVLYAPTIRRTIMDDSRVAALVETINANQWSLVIKLHPVRGRSQKPAYPDLSVAVRDFSALEMLAIADAVITDYSAIVYEAYLRQIPTYFYAHDMDEYERARGFYTSPSQFPSKIYESPEDLGADMNNGVANLDAMKAFVDVFLEDSPGRVDILDLITPPPGL